MITWPVIYMAKRSDLKIIFYVSKSFEFINMREEER